MRFWLLTCSCVLNTVCRSFDDVDCCTLVAIGEGWQLQMLTRGQMLIIKAGETAKLECEFISETFGLFDNPVVWRKTQRLEQSQINMMGNLMEPFASSRRFRASYQPYSPRYVFGLTIESKHSNHPMKLNSSLFCSTTHSRHYVILICYAFLHANKYIK